MIDGQGKMAAQFNLQLTGNNSGCSLSWPNLTLSLTELRIHRLLKIGVEPQFRLAHAQTRGPVAFSLRHRGGL